MVKRIINEEHGSSVWVHLKVKASQVQDSGSNSDSESYKSASEGKGPGSSDSEKTQESPSKNYLSYKGVEVKRNLKKKEREREGACGDERENGKRMVDHSPTANLSVFAICGVEQENVEESGKKSGGSGSGEAAERIGASYDQKKQRTPIPKAPSAPKPTKKRKVSSPTPTEISLPKERATRSRVKQSESDLQKVVAESKKKKMAKGNGKVAESSEAKSPRLLPRSLPLCLRLLNLH
ncbi:uncharacterized protein [Nicotiana sylvestris]|uniref:uncharacterized protein n=1 Tax=Nicotiana sylvestris TaxID=4096 RepID=UPI00388C4696